MYLRDPGGNLVEIELAGRRTLDRSIFTDLRRLADDQPAGCRRRAASLLHGASTT